MKKIVVIGQGYMGFPLSLLLAKAGYSVVGFDTDEVKVKKIKRGSLPFKEKGLSGLYKEVITSHPGRYDISSIIKPADIFIISVPTPKNGNKADMKYVYLAAQSICSVLDNDNLIILESTSPPNSTKNLAVNYFDKCGKRYNIAYCPERAFPGKTIYELIHNDRIVGGLDTKATSRATEVYTSFSKGRVHKTNSLTAEVCKLAENAYRDVNIAFANELSILGNELGYDTHEVISLANKHPRVSILNPGPGVGGHCIPIDPLFLVENTLGGDLIRTARIVNDKMPSEVVSLLYSKFGNDLGPLGVLGLSYKEGVDDYRESPSLEVVHGLIERGCKVMVHDTYIKKISGVTLDFQSLESLLANSKTIVITTGHKNYETIDFNQYPNIKYIFDTRGVIPTNKYQELKAKIASI